MWYLVFWLVTGSGASVPVQPPKGFDKLELCKMQGENAADNLRFSKDLAFPPVIAYTCNYEQGK